MFAGTDIGQMCCAILSMQGVFQICPIGLVGVSATGVDTDGVFASIPCYTKI